MSLTRTDLVHVVEENMEIRLLVPRGLMVLTVAALSVPDIRTKKIPLYMLLFTLIPVALSIVFNIAGNFWGGEWVTGEVFLGRELAVMGLGLIPGAALIVLSKATGKVGLADGIVLSGMGLMEGFMGALSVMCFGSLLLSIPAAALLAARKVKKQTGLPFIPFLGAGYLIWIFLICR